MNEYPALAERLLEHVRKPWILIDDVLSFSADQITCRKLISSSDLFLLGHFPGHSIYPGVLLLEGIRQSAEILLKYLGIPVVAPRVFEARFLAPVLPGQTVIYRVSLIKETTWPSMRLSGRGYVNDGEVVRAKLTIPGSTN